MVTTKKPQIDNQALTFVNSILCDNYTWFPDGVNFTSSDSYMLFECKHVSKAINQFISQKKEFTCIWFEVESDFSFHILTMDGSAFALIVPHSHFPSHHIGLFIQLIVRMWTYVLSFALASVFFRSWMSCENHLSIYSLVIFSSICTFKQVLLYTHEIENELPNEQASPHAHKCNLRIVESKQLRNSTYLTQAAKMTTTKKNRMSTMCVRHFFSSWGSKILLNEGKIDRIFSILKATK